jgi:hypothetical protein
MRQAADYPEKTADFEDFVRKALPPAMISTFEDQLRNHALPFAEGPDAFSAVVEEIQSKWAGPNAFGTLCFAGQGLGPSPGISDYRAFVMHVQSALDSYWD